MVLLSGNEAIARGAWEAGATIGVGYPGTPSTETLEQFARFPEVYAEWCVNEKVAVEVATGASAAGARVLATMKHVGVNVAADPLFTAAYTGVNGGLVVLAADDPGMYSSQNEQDSHYYGCAAHVPVFDPADSQEALDYTKYAFEVSERFDVPAIIRSTVRISHTKTVVKEGEREERELLPYRKDPAKWVMMPAFAKPRRKVQLDRIQALNEWSDACNLHRHIEGTDGGAVGVVCAGAVFQHVRAALPAASVFKLAVTYPLPAQRLREFAAGVDTLYVIEEGSEYLRNAVAQLGIQVSGFPHSLPTDGELNPGLIRQACGLPVPESRAFEGDLPNRPPALCPGCPHRLVFAELSRLKAIVTGDIGCYTLGALPPLSSIDSVLCMGASVSMAHGFEIALSQQDHRPVVAVIGDSTFAHSGLSSLISTVYNSGSGTICILDNRTTAMTGRQGNPFNGQTLQGRATRELDLEGILRALGIADLQVVDPYDRDAVRNALASAVSNKDVLSVRIFRAPCILLERKQSVPFTISPSCIGCGVCATIGCPAISIDREAGLATIDAGICNGCGVCASYCSRNSIVRAEM